MDPDKLYRKYQRNVAMSGNGRLLTPGQMNVTTTYADGRLAQPTSVPIQTPDRLQVLICGGLTKVEALAGQIAAGITARDGSTDDVWIVDRAEAILAECARRREPAKETP
jgi:hypothetical protein